MSYRLVPYSVTWLEAVERCNRRLTSSGAAPFLLPEGTPASGLIHREHWVAVGEDNEVRGGCLLQFQPAWIDGEVAQAINIQSPLSEGFADRRHVALAAWMLRELVRRHPFAYSVGMGGSQMPYARLLKALGWQLQLVPFYFRVLAGRRFLPHTQPVRQHPTLATVARLGGAVPLLPDLAIALLHAWRTTTSRTVIQNHISDWTRIRTRYGFAINRTPEILDALYPIGDARFCRLDVAGGVGVVSLREFSGHKYFGDLRVATLVEMLTELGAEQALTSAALQSARRLGADLLLTNQTAPELCTALSAAGWLPYSSNYLVAFAPALSAAIAGRPVYVTRGDGDGLLNL
jgi:hypothetical protein